MGSNYDKLCYEGFGILNKLVWIGKISIEDLEVCVRGFFVVFLVIWNFGGNFKERKVNLLVFIGDFSIFMRLTNLVRNS